jgi:hypothetical protein
MDRNEDPRVDPAAADLKRRRELEERALLEMDRKKTAIEKELRLRGGEPLREVNFANQGPTRASVHEILRTRARHLRQEAQSLDELAEVLPTRIGDYGTDEVFYQLVVGALAQRGRFGGL